MGLPEPQGSPLSVLCDAPQKSCTILKSLFSFWVVVQLLGGGSLNFMADLYLLGDHDGPSSCPKATSFRCRETPGVLELVGQCLFQHLWFEPTPGCFLLSCLHFRH